MLSTGLKNIYMCRTCGHGFVSIDLVDGTTPFLTACLNCKKPHAASFFYRAPQELLGTPAIEWYRPTETEVLRMSAVVQEHVKRGGLIRRRYRPRQEEKA